MSTSLNRIARQARPAAQRGVSLMFALIALVVLMLGGAALLRSVDSGQLAIGNLGFKQDATMASSQAVDAAIAWMQGKLANTSALDNDGAQSSGYFASSLDKLDPTGTRVSDSSRAVVDWDNDGTCGGAASGTTCMHPMVPWTDTVTGNSLTYVITRLCAAAGSYSTVDCARPAAAGGGNSMDRGVPGYGTGRFTGTSAGPYYRVIARVKGARGTISITETIVHF